MAMFCIRDWLLFYFSDLIMMVFIPLQNEIFAFFLINAINEQDSELGRNYSHGGLHNFPINVITRSQMFQEQRNVHIQLMQLLK